MIDTRKALPHSAVCSVDEAGLPGLRLQCKDGKQGVGVGSGETSG
ncbi:MULTISPECIES: hypothetical protein [Paenibacillus]|nr:hypothetical protein [Paenibacillus caseinilyticus]MCZ8518145.1 hypothetical protein [Paenibacillus caseinilyticus]